MTRCHVIGHLSPVGGNAADWKHIVNVVTVFGRQKKMFENSSKGINGHILQVEIEIVQTVDISTFKGEHFFKDTNFKPDKISKEKLTLAGTLLSCLHHKKLMYSMM